MSYSASRLAPRNAARLTRAQAKARLDQQLTRVDFSYVPAPAYVAHTEPRSFTFPFCDARWYSDRVTAYGPSPAVVMYKKSRTHSIVLR